MLVFGFLSVLLVMWILHRMDHFSDVPRVYRLGLRPLFYTPWLLKEIVKSNILVALGLVVRLCAGPGGRERARPGSGLGALA